VTPETVSVTGPARSSTRWRQSRANVAIDATGLDIDQDVELIPVDNVGDRLTPVDVEPTTAHVTIAVFKQTESRPLPVTPVLSGAPAAGYEVTGIAVSPRSCRSRAMPTRSSARRKRRRTRSRSTA
jgi:YbbR domain-containing protein